MVNGETFRLVYQEYLQHQHDYVTVCLIEYFSIALVGVYHDNFTVVVL